MELWRVIARLVTFDFAIINSWTLDPVSRDTRTLPKLSVEFVLEECLLAVKDFCSVRIKRCVNDRKHTN